MLELSVLISLNLLTLVVVVVDAASKSVPKAPVSIKSNVNDLNANKKNHILQDKHNWNKLVPNPKGPHNWGKIATIISTVLANGTQQKYGNENDVFIKACDIGGKIVEVTYKIIDGVAHISDAWVK